MTRFICKDCNKHFSCLSSLLWHKKKGRMECNRCINEQIVKDAEMLGLKVKTVELKQKG
jgi:transposase